MEKYKNLIKSLLTATDYKVIKESYDIAENELDDFLFFNMEFIAKLLGYKDFNEMYIERKNR